MMVQPVGDLAVDRQNRKPRVLVVGPADPARGGVGMVDHVLLTCELTNTFEMLCMDTGRGRAGTGKEGTWALVNFGYFFRQIMQLLWLLLARRPQIMHQTITCGVAFWKESFFMLLARCLGVTVVGHVHGSKLDVQLRDAGSLQIRMMRLAFHLPHAVLVLSERWRVLLSKTVSPSLNLVVVPNSVDHSIAKAMDCQVAEDEREENLVLFLGWLGTRKGLPDALRAVPLVHEEVPEARFIFAGPLEAGPQKETIALACEAVQREGAASFPGIVMGQDKLSLLRRASIFILPSHHENLPVAILEAMAMGLPVISTSIAGIPEVVEDGCNGFLISPGDYQALADRIVRLARDPDLRLRMGLANITKVRQQYHPKVFASNIERVYLQLLGSRQLRRTPGARSARYS